MEFLIGIIILIIVLCVIGFFAKKKYFNMIDKMEAWKIEVMNRPVLDEVGKIKQLNMSGQAEEYFEEWRKTWDSIVTIDLPSVEEWLFDAEDYIEKFRFKKAQGIIEKIEWTLEDCEKKINDMVDKLNEIFESEEKNREDYIELQDLYKKIKKNLLAHQHAYGKAAKKLEVMLLNTDEKFQEITTETENGNYLTAREKIKALFVELDGIFERMEVIPLLLNDCGQIPNQIKDLKAGLEEMQEAGYILDHLDLEKEIERLEHRLKVYLEQIENAEIEEAAPGIEDIKEDIDLLYDLLEKEVISKQYVLENSPIIGQSVKLISDTKMHLVETVENVRLNYHLTAEDEELFDSINKRVEEVKKSVQLLYTQLDDKKLAYSILQNNIESIINEIESIEQHQQNFTIMLQALRKDELEAREKIQQLRRKLQETTRIVSRSNAPGIPNQIEMKFLDAGEVLQDCNRYLEQSPLSMVAVRENLQKAEEIISDLHDEVVIMIENVYLIERIIQYGNKYRKSYPAVSEKLNQAETAFRQLDYERALEEAASAVESVEPGAIKRIEEILNEEKQ